MAQKHWDEFWEQGFITTFGAPLEHNYTGKLKALWEQLFSNLCSGNNLLDLGTGNGALPCIAYSVLNKRNKSVNIHAIDSAKIPPNITASPEIQEARKNIQFSGESPCESLRFPDNKFDLITSQFGIEYSNWAQSLPEVFRVLKPGCGSHFVCHSLSSALIIATKQDLSVYKSALEEQKVFDHAALFAQQFQMEGEKKSTAARALNDSINELRSRHPDQELSQIIVSDLSQQLRQLKTTPPEIVKESIKARERSFIAAQARQKDMLNAALDESDVTYILQLAKKIGFESCTAEDFSQDGNLIGVYISLTK
ncbi:class I SAM-dependent methyltransferase [Microbulbifer sp. CAU 1566]|uniref:class I SAM-dependent methyltransferase n=1 Tax=Microbulbifer sp. CAU 1566 TaxID=2933269 RepID=UPI002002C2C9|nr:class I SAM-dependent methyltransferase [Microbulbifer sp. CAU 1566]MCK7596058.1 class I SAM-dependent methyltransferase [Microbulbifer sp. CAU 1566]